MYKRQIQTRISGDSRYTYSWAASSGIPGLFDNPNKMDPIVSPSPIGKATYTVKATHPKCPNKDSVAEFDVEVQPVPDVKLGNDASMCEGDTMKLNADIIPAGYPFSLNWTPGASLDNSTIVNPIFKAQQTTPVSYTHLDVYKRQPHQLSCRNGLERYQMADLMVRR